MNIFNILTSPICNFFLIFISVTQLQIFLLENKYLLISCKRGLAEDCLKVYENCADHLNNNLILQEITILTFFQFYWKINKNQSQIVVETTYGLNLY